MTNVYSLWWFGHLEKMNEDQIAKQIYRGRVSGIRGKTEKVPDGVDEIFQ